MSDASRAEGPADHRLAADILGAGRGRHAFEDCVERLATAIRLGVFAEGSTLPSERELSSRMGVSRTTLREAIAALREAGMVRTVRGRGGGTIVSQRPTTPARGPRKKITEQRDRLMDSLVFRRVVEPGAAQLAAERGLGEEERRLLRSSLAGVGEAEKPAEYRQADSRLHLAIATTTGSAQLIEAVTRAQADLHTLLTAIPMLPANIDHSDAQHDTIVDAILRGRATTARRTMEQHCDDTAALLRGLLS
ncbi:FadR/GntR family transcriptional regulator [Microlunatus soli]|uniref:Transcriptional regulator, GntR family n=1 Tax=Microlunatus soli TaxID=630515 RepID=A0A1H1XAN5_9ACTN|nr:FCD domain-containing protein [Microlunatus soli]SDT06354.1 transcriptional regulator, GntR family [Microlunatus soli]